MSVGMTTRTRPKIATALAAMVEVGPAGRWRVNDCMTVNGGYQAMLLSELALATDQLDAIDPVPAIGGVPVGLGNQLDYGGAVILHGLFLGLEVCRRATANQ